MEERKTFLVDGYSNGRGVPSSGGYRDPNTGQLISQYTNPRPYKEVNRPQKIVVDNSAYVKNELKGKALGYTMDLAYWGIDYLLHRPRVQATINRGLSKFVDLLLGNTEEKKSRQPRDMYYQDYEPCREQTYSKPNQYYGTWSELEPVEKVSSRRAYPELATHNDDMVVISRAAYEELMCRRGKQTDRIEEHRRAWDDSVR